MSTQVLIIKYYPEKVIDFYVDANFSGVWK